ncbi:MAG: hypothetical protein WC736_15640 [Gallionella sp.]|jgi:hypothetical protein
MKQQIGDNYVDNVSEVSPIETTYDAVANDSNKSWTVPNGEMWKLNWARMLLVTSADVGNRQSELIVKDEAGNTVFSIKAGAIQGASTTRVYHYSQHVSHEAAFVVSEIQAPIPSDLYLPAGFTLQLWDSSAIAAAADDMTISFQVKVYKGA